MLICFSRFLLLQYLIFHLQVYDTSLKILLSNIFRHVVEHLIYEVNPSTLRIIYPVLSIKTTLFSYTKTKNGTVVVVGHNLHKIDKRHSQSSSNRYLVPLYEGKFVKVL